MYVTQISKKDWNSSLLRAVAISLFAVNLDFSKLFLGDPDDGFQIHATNDGVGEIGVRKVGTGHDGGGEIGAGEICTREVDIDEIGTDERCLLEARPSELGIDEAGDTEIDEIEFEIGKIKPN